MKKKNYPDVSGLFKTKSEWRQQMAKRPISDKIEAVSRLRQLSKEVPKLTRTSKTSIKKK
jgi:hypothetical protein